MKLGTDGYCRVQKETTYGTADTSAMTLLPILEGTEIKATRAMIENKGILGSRINPAPELGRTLADGKLLIDAHPGLIGNIYNFMFGAATSTAVGDGAYNHYWLQDLTNERDGSIFTLELAQGSELADQYVSCVANKLIITADTENLVKYEIDFVAKTWATDVARISSFSYPTLIPYNFGHFTISEAGLGTLSNIESLSLEIDLNMDIERYKLGDVTRKRAVFNGRPIVSLKLTVDGDQQWIDAARAHTAYDFTITLTGTDEAGTTPTYYSTAIELPGCRLNPETLAPTTHERIKMDLEFDCSYGGTTTNGGSNNYMWEVRLTDTATAYTA